MINKIVPFFVLVLVAVLQPCKAQQQNNSSAEKFDTRLLVHYSEKQLIDLRANHPQKFETLVKYYTASYSLVKTPCAECGPCVNCPVTEETKFDVSQFEQMRKQSERTVLQYKTDGNLVTIELFSIDELDFDMPCFHK